MDEPLTIRSYRRVFRVDHRIYRVDRWRVPVPGGIPMITVGYFAGTLLAVLVLELFPGTAELLEIIPPPFRFVVLPLAVAVLGLQAAPDGRVAHRFAADWLRFHARARRRCAGRAVALEGEPRLVGGTLGVVWDEHAPALHGCRVVGPAHVRFNEPVGLSWNRETLVAREGGKPGDVVLGIGVPLEVQQ